MAENEVEALAGEFLGHQPEEGATHEHGEHGEPGTSTSVRELEHGGHHVRIETTYRISIDGQPLQGHIEVLPSGQVHYHRFPQYAPQSAVDVVKTIIDTIWDKPEVPDELGHRHGHGHRGDR